LFDAPGENDDENDEEAEHDEEADGGDDPEQIERWLLVQHPGGFSHH